MSDVDPFCDRLSSYVSGREGLSADERRRMLAIIADFEFEVMGVPSDRNVITDKAAERAREIGGYTFNALIDPEYDGVVVVIAVLRLGEHAHLEVSTGRTIPNSPQHRLSYSLSGHLTLRWPEWLLIRPLLVSVPWTRIAEVERPSPGQLRRHVP